MMQTMNAGVFLNSFSKIMDSSRASDLITSKDKQDFKNYLNGMFDQLREQHPHHSTKDRDIGNKKSDMASIKPEGKKDAETISDKTHSKASLKKPSQKKEAVLCCGDNDDTSNNNGSWEKECTKSVKDDNTIIPYEIIIDILNALECMNNNTMVIDNPEFDHMLKNAVIAVVENVPELEDTKAAANLLQFLKTNFSEIMQLKEEGKLEEGIAVDKGILLTGHKGTFVDISIENELDLHSYIANNEQNTKSIASVVEEPSEVTGAEPFQISKIKASQEVEFATLEEEIQSKDLNNGSHNFMVEAATDEETLKAGAKQGANSKQDDSLSQMLKESDIKSPEPKPDSNSINPEAGFNVNIPEVPSNPLDDILNVSSSHESEIKKEDIVFQIVEKAKVILDGEKNEMSIDLKPDHLGKLSLKVVTERGIVMAEFVAENEQVKAVLDSNMQFLKDALERQGFDIKECAVSVGQKNSEGKGENAPRDHKRYDKGRRKIETAAISMGYEAKSLSSSGYGYDVFDERRINVTA